jgi:hypothetical protein
MPLEMVGLDKWSPAVRTCLGRSVQAVVVRRKGPDGGGRGAIHGCALEDHEGRYVPGGTYIPGGGNGGNLMGSVAGGMFRTYQPAGRSFNRLSPD